MLCVAMSCAASGALAQSQSWNYKSYLKDPVSGRYDKGNFRVSTVKIEEKDGRATFRMLTSGRGDPCFSAGDLPAEVERTAQTTTITVLPTLAGCAPFRYVIQNDGGGGVRLNQREGRWVPDGLDHDLTALK
jgi:hypothetical protein